MADLGSPDQKNGADYQIDIISVESMRIGSLALGPYSYSRRWRR